MQKKSGDGDLKVLSLYYTSTGNTEKVADRIERTVRDLGHEVDSVRITSDKTTVDVLDHDLVFNGSGVYQWLPGEPMRHFFGELMDMYSEESRVEPGCPKRPNKDAVVYCTYGGVHTGKNEALPAVKYMGQMFEHLGFVILGEWYVVGEYPEDMGAASREGRLGDIRGRPNENDLAEIEERVKGVLSLKKREYT